MPEGGPAGDGSSRVAVTGFGVTSAFGRGTAPLLDGVMAGRPAFSQSARFDTSGCRARAAAELAGVADLTAELPAVIASACEAAGLDAHAREAARLLRAAGLTELTECALRTRAYRKQVPFHLNGRRIVFTLSDLREIAEGEALRPQSPARAAMPGATPQPVPRRRSPMRRIAATGDPWRARRPDQAGRRSAMDGGRTSET